MSKFKNIILLGPPACGKGTQGKRVAELLQLPVLGTGNLLRKAIDQKTDLGLEAEGYINKGLYVPDSLIESLVAEWSAQNTEGWIYDGFPRTQTQADFIDNTAEITQPDLVLAFDVPQADLENRVTSRRQCDTCDHVTSTFVYDKEECPEAGCDGKLYARNDDALDSFRVRYEQYEKMTGPLFDFYRNKGLLVEIDGSQKPEDVYKDVLKALEGDTVSA